MPTDTIRCPHCGRTNRVPAVATGYPRCGNCHNPLPWMVDAGDDNFTDVVEKSSLFVIVDMWAAWCGPCRAISPGLERVAADLAGKVKLVKVNVDAAPRLAQRFTVQAVPTLLVFHDGRIVARQAGAAPVPALRKWVDEAMATEGASA